MNSMWVQGTEPAKAASDLKFWAIYPAPKVNKIKLDSQIYLREKNHFES